ncbi:major facilitator superfamily domain-containing protein [Halteromyces radiatus]|uniref:major facilitator superfamily domain-containing protein n=1 Tax=Halteromyces radiatus TaxID=101107 RepID=UPI00221F0AEF|nr:major facilitator superfamily domain-containing protein [Halteromyces radiatus]KAI8086542.1 major facilitator superfamily domain-containing protein [Halteromyces radiatus]
MSIEKIETTEVHTEKFESSWGKDVEYNGETVDFVEPDAKEMRKLLWKLDLRIVPWLGVLYLCSFLDRVNIGNAKLAGLQADLKVSDDVYNWALSIFFIGYIIFEIPSNMMMKKIGPNRWIPLVMIAWGVTMACMAAITNSAGLLASRFFLGITEAGLFPGAIYYLSLWFTRQEQATRVSIFFSCATVAGAFGGVLAYGIMQMNGLQGLTGWQWIFIIEALPTILLSVATYFILPDLPHRAKFINERERAIVLHRLKKDAGPSTETHFSWKQFFAVFVDWKVYMHSLIYICGATPLYSLSLFLPSIIKGMGYTDLAAQAMSAPPYAIACFFTVMIALHADKKRERGLHIAVPAFVGMIGYLLLVVLKDRGPVAMYIAAVITTTGVFSHIPSMLSWFTNNIGGHTKRGVASAFIISIGNVGGAIGGQVYRADDAPYYSRGHEICLGLMCGAWVCSLLFKFLLERENKRRDNLTPEQHAKEASGEELCDLHPDFRYIS